MKGAIFEAIDRFLWCYSPLALSRAAFAFILWMLILWTYALHQQDSVAKMTAYGISLLCAMIGDILMLYSNQVAKENLSFSAGIALLNMAIFVMLTGAFTKMAIGASASSLWGDFAKFGILISGLALWFTDRIMQRQIEERWRESHAESALCALRAWKGIRWVVLVLFFGFCGAIRIVDHGLDFMARHLAVFEGLPLA